MLIGWMIQLYCRHAQPVRGEGNDEQCLLDYLQRKSGVLRCIFLQMLDSAALGQAADHSQIISI